MRAFAPALRQAAFLILLAAVPSVLAALFHPSRPDPSRIPRIEAADVKAWTKPFVWVDARPPAEFLRGAIPGAVSLSEDDWDRSIDAFADAWEPGVPVVVYCGGGDCGASDSVARRLKREAGVTEIFVLRGGVDAWRSSR